jgi:hypothetical protein
MPEAHTRTQREREREREREYIMHKIAYTRGDFGVGF